MKKLLMMLALASCRTQSPEMERALNELQASYRADCIEGPYRMNPRVMESCAHTLTVLQDNGRMR